MSMSMLMLRESEEMIKRCIYNTVVECSVLYNFDAEEAMRRVMGECVSRDVGTYNGEGVLKAVSMYNGECVSKEVGTYISKEIIKEKKSRAPKGKKETKKEEKNVEDGSEVKEPDPKEKVVKEKVVKEPKEKKEKVVKEKVVKEPKEKKDKGRPKKEVKDVEVDDMLSSLMNSMNLSEKVEVEVDDVSVTSTGTKKMKGEGKVEVDVDVMKEEEEVDVVKKITFQGSQYLKSKKTDIIYNMDQEVVGKWNKKTETIDFEDLEEEEEEYIE